MADFSRVQKRLNDDAKFRSQFLEDPISAVCGEGVITTPDMEQKLTAFAKEAAAPHKAGTGSQTASINGGIGISVRF